MGVDLERVSKFTSASNPASPNHRRHQHHRQRYVQLELYQFGENSVSVWLIRVFVLQVNIWKLSLVSEMLIIKGFHYLIDWGYIQSKIRVRSVLIRRSSATMSNVYGFAGREGKNQGRTIKISLRRNVGKLVTPDMHYFRGRELLMN